MTVATPPIERFYDSHRVEGDPVGQNGFHLDAVIYLIELLRWLYREQQVYVGGQLNLYRTPDPMEEYTEPDVLVIPDITPHNQREEGLPSYYIGHDGPPPSVIIEVSSPTNWKDDFDKKRAIYQEVGVSEYFIYDTHARPLWTCDWRKRERLVGWRRDLFSGEFKEIESASDNQRRLKSLKLQSDLVIEGRNLRLYDSLTGELRLTGYQAEQAARKRAQEQEALELGRVQEQIKAEQAARKRAQEQAEKLADFLRSQGFDPDKII